MVVTTEHKGVFFGYAQLNHKKTIRLEQAQMCVYWSASVRGVVGLSTTGPDKQCKIGPPCPAITLHDITSVMECSQTAEAAWKTQPWN